jgi:hypothetical protein
MSFFGPRSLGAEESLKFLERGVVNASCKMPSYFVVSII